MAALPRVCYLRAAKQMEGTLWQWTIFFGSLAGILLLLYRAYVRPLAGLGRGMIVLLFLIRLCAGLGISGLYTYHYTDRSRSDIWKYFEDGRILRETAFEKPLVYLKMMTGFFDEADPEVFEIEEKMGSYYRSGRSYLHADHRFFIRIHALLHWISARFMPVHVLWICLAGFLMLLDVWRVLSLRFPEQKILWVWLLFLLPESLAWTTAPLKETLAMPLMLYIFCRPMAAERNITYKIPNICIALSGLWLLKPYLMIICLAGLALSLLWHHRLRAWLAGIAALGMLAAVLFLTGPMQDLAGRMAGQRNEFAAIAATEDAGSLLPYPQNCHTAEGFLQDIPRAIWVSLILPLPGMQTGLIHWLSGISNVLFLLLLLLLLSRADFSRLKEESMLPGLLLSAALLLLLIGWTVPVLGSVVRYRVPAQIALLVIAGVISDNLYLFISEKFPVIRKLFSSFLEKHIEI